MTDGVGSAISVADGVLSTLSLDSHDTLVEIDIYEIGDSDDIVPIGNTL